MRRYEHGEYIDLRWDGHPEAVYVRGHVAPEDAADAIDAYHGGDVRHGEFTEAWARWSVEGCSEDGPGGGVVLREYAGPSSGRFPIMRADVIAESIDPATWAYRKTGTRFSRTEGEIPATPDAMRCDCRHWRYELCKCAGSCRCHWQPAIGDPWRLAEQDATAVDAAREE